MPYLAFNLNDGNEFVFDLLEDRLSLGRDPKNDIVIDNGFISGHHAEFLRQEDGTYEVVDLKSSNGTFVNGKRVERSKVKGGDRILFGRLESRYRERAPKGLAPADAAKAATAKATPPGPTVGVVTRKACPTKAAPADIKLKAPPPPTPPGPVSAASPKDSTEKVAMQPRIVAATASVPASSSSTVPLTAAVDDSAHRAEARLLADKIDAQRRELADLETKIHSHRNDLLVAEKDLAAAQTKAQASAADQAKALEQAGSPISPR